MLEIPIQKIHEYNGYRQKNGDNAGNMAKETEIFQSFKIFLSHDEGY